MKKFYTIACGCIVAGLVLMGVGAAVCVCEVNSFQYMGNKYENTMEPVVTRTDVQLPDNLAKIYYGEWENLEIVPDSTLQGNNAVLETTYTSNHEIEIGIKINDNRYLRNDYTGDYSKYTVNELEIDRTDHYDSELNDFNEFKSILNDIKNRTIYDYNSVENVSITLRVSEEAYERFSTYPEGYSVLSYGNYMEDMENRRYADEYDEYDENTYEDSYDDYDDSYEDTYNYSVG